MPCVASFFDTIFGVKKLQNFKTAITYTGSACYPSNEAFQNSGFAFIIVGIAISHNFLLGLNPYLICSYLFVMPFFLICV